MLQTVYREIETQTEPFDPDLKEVSSSHRDGGFPEFDTEYRPDVLALASLKTGSGLPVETQFDVDRVKSLVRLQREEDRLDKLEVGDKAREDGRGRVLGERQQLEWRAREEKMADTRGHRETALDGYIKGWNRLANAKIEERLSRLWAKKQQEKEEKFAKLRKQHERELRMLAKRSQKKVDNIFRGVGGTGGDKLNTEEILKYEYASAPIKVRVVGCIF